MLVQTYDPDDDDAAHHTYHYQPPPRATRHTAGRAVRVDADAHALLAQQQPADAP